MRIAVCDDDLAFLARISSLVESWAAGRGLAATVDRFPDGESLIGAHARAAFDIILLDVVMPELDGIEAARRIRTADREVKLVFLTSSSEFAVDSSAVKASNYLLKPADPAALERCLDELADEVMAADRRIMVRGAYEVHSIRPGDIEFVEACGKHVEITLSDGRRIVSVDPLYACEDRLFFSDGFYKCHRSYIVNINHVGTYAPDAVTMRGGARIPIARGCRAEFKEAYFSVLFGKAGDEAW